MCIFDLRHKYKMCQNILTLTEDQILALAPDAASQKAGKDLGQMDKWVSYGADFTAIWGECQGSGSKPYQTQIDSQNIAFKCSCPSRKFPCKHGLGLLLLYAKNNAVFSGKEAPGWVKEWIDKRGEKSEKIAENVAKPVDEAAQAKRQQARIKKVNEGIEELLLWIKDVIRNGLLQIPGKESSFRALSKRMVDAQAPGLAGIINTFEEINFYKEGWQSLLLDKLITLYLLITGYKNQESLSHEMKLEIAGLIGFAQSQEELKAKDGIRDDWFVMGKQISEDAQLTIERNWLYGINTRKYALILQFYVKNQVKGLTLTTGSIIDAELVFYNPGLATRALLKQQHEWKPPVIVKGLNNWKESIAQQAADYENNPFTSEIPFIVEQLKPVIYNERWWLKDRDDNMMVMKLHGDALWQFLAASGGQATTLALVGKDNEFTPIGMWLNNRYFVI